MNRDWDMKPQRSHLLAPRKLKHASPFIYHFYQNHLPTFVVVYIEQSAEHTLGLVSLQSSFYKNSKCSFQSIYDVRTFSFLRRL